MAIDIPVQTLLWSARHKIHSLGEPERKILKLLVRVFPSLFPGSVDNSSFKLRIFSPAAFSFSGTQVALGQRGIIGLAKALYVFGFFGIVFDNAFVMVDCRRAFLFFCYWGFNIVAFKPRRKVFL